MEWIRCITILITLFAIFEYIRYYIKKREPGIFAILSWLVLVLGYTIFKWYAGSSQEYYIASVIWSNIVLVQGVVLSIAALIIFRGYNPNGH